MSIGDVQGRFCLIKRVNWLVYIVMAALVGIALIYIWLICKANTAASDPVYTLHAKIRVANPLPRELDATQLLIKLPFSLDAALPELSESIQVQKSGMGQQLLYSPSKVAAGSEHEIALDISLLESSEVVDARSHSAELHPHDVVGIRPAIIPPLTSDDAKRLDTTLLNAVKQAKSLAEYQVLFARLEPSHLVSSATVAPLTQEQAVRYAYLLGLMTKDVELKQPVSLFAGWVFDPKGHGSYQLWAETGSKENRVRWPSPESGFLYLPAEQVNIVEFIANPISFFNPVSGFGLEAKSLELTLQKQKSK